MSKVEMAIQNTNWQIEAAEKEIVELRDRIKSSIDSVPMEIYADSILAYAQRMAEAAQKLRQLREQKKMLEYITED